MDVRDQVPSFRKWVLRFSFRLEWGNWSIITSAQTKASPDSTDRNDYKHSDVQDRPLMKTWSLVGANLKSNTIRSVNHFA